jgi:hypothetical protein
MPAHTTESLYNEILEREVRLARSVAITTRRLKPFSVWEVLIPIVFILGYMRSRHQRELFVQNFIFTKKLALQAARKIHLNSATREQAFGHIETKTRKLLETLEPHIYSEPIQQAQLVEIDLLISHYQRLFNTKTKRYADSITAAYPARKDYTVFLDNLRRAEKEVAAAAVETVGAGADRDMVARIEACSHQLRLKAADRFYAHA